MSMFKQWVDKHLQGDPMIWLIVFALSLFSIVVVYSAAGTLAYQVMDGNTEYYLFKHTFQVILSLLAMWVAHKIDYRYYAKLSKLALWISIPLLLYAWNSGVTINEASRWIRIPIVNQVFQPSDLAKLALIASLATMLSKRQHNIDDFKDSLIPILLWCGVICGLIGMANMSSAVLLFATCMLLMFIGRVPFKYLAMLAIVGVLAATVALNFGQRGATTISRVQNFLNPTEIPYQAEQSYMAIAGGGLLGKGPGHSDQRHLLPHAYSDFIYAIIIEEYGMVGGVVVILLYLALLYRGMITVANSQRAYGGLLSAGLSFALVVQAMVNMGVAVGLGPITGLTLPLVSMGGTSLLFTGISLGIIISVGRGEIDETLNSNIGDIKNIAKAA